MTTHAISTSLPYQQEIVQQLLEDDALLILGKGLGLHLIVANLVHLLGISMSDSTKSSLILLINASASENHILGEQLMELTWLEDGRSSPFTVIGPGEATTADKRRAIYSRGGIISISNRILVTDFLAEVLDPSLVTGLVVLHAERVNDYSNDRFVVNLYRRKNKWGFVKAVSDEPVRLSVGFQPLSSHLRFLKLSKSLLWPRFHVDVTSSLRTKHKDNTVTEVRVQLTDYTQKIQTALLACIEALVGELRRNNPETATEYWTAKNALDDAFTQRIRMTLDPVWHRISYTSRQIVFDLEVLKNLLNHLLEYDSVEFYRELSAIVEANKPSITSSNKNSATWLMLDESMTMIACAKARVFEKVDETTSMLEEQPKLEQLAMILDDINQTKEHTDSVDDGPTLIMVSSFHTASQIREYLETCETFTLDTGKKVFAGRKMMLQSLRNYYFWKGGTAVNSMKIQRGLEAAENAAKEESKDEEEELRISKTFLRGHQPSTKRRRTRGGAVIAEHDRLLSKDLDADEVDENTIDMQQLDDDDDEEADPTFGNELPSYSYLNRTSQIVIEQFDSKNTSLILDELQPSNIILYEPNLAFIRKVELYQAPRNQQRARCYFMYYGGSVEEERYLLDIKQEKDSFTKLIREKATMPKIFTTDDDEVAKFAPDPVRNTRIAGGGLTAIPKVKVIVDMREFRSRLPFLCHLAGLEVIPCMLTVGDYILSPEICVERKSVPDLVGSLKGGRLYQQCEQMFRYYKRPTLLIEFDEGKSFSMQPFNTFKNGVLMPSTTDSSFAQKDLQLKLMVLITAFPALKIIWSSSPFETARIFKELKVSQAEPDVSVAVDAGLDREFGKETLFNDASIDMIQNIPGIDAINYHLIISKVKSVYELSKMSQDSLSELIGSEAARKVDKFFKRKA